jgi:hypothetical protein
VRHTLERLALNGDGKEQAAELLFAWPVAAAAPAAGQPFFRAPLEAAETPLERAARERREDSEKAAALEALRAPRRERRREDAGFSLDRLAPDTCESHFDCDAPLVCCDLLIARVCCSAGARVGPRRAGALIPIPVESDGATGPALPR